MSDSWSIIDGMVSELGDLYALEVEASSYPDIANAPAVREVHMAVLRVTDAMGRVTEGMSRTGLVPRQPAIRSAREALDAAGSAAVIARRLLADARATRNSRP